MRMNESGRNAANSANQMLHMNFQDFVSKEQNTVSMELASEFGVSLQDVKKLRKHFNRR